MELVETYIPSKSEYLADRVEKALYMGFLLDDKVNEYLSVYKKGISIDTKDIERCVMNYNSKISSKGYKIKVSESEKYNSMTFWILGSTVHFSGDDLADLLNRLKERIERNCQISTTSYCPIGIEVFDLDLLVPLRRTGVTTMGDTYLAFNGKKYIVNFMHLYNVYLGY